MENSQNPRVAPLAGSRMPADLGLSSLGLIMQLAGSLFMGVGGLLALTPILAGGAPGAWVIFLVGAMAAVRSGFHRAAGTALIYGHAGNALQPVYTYIIVSCLQVAATSALLFFVADGGLSGTSFLSLAMLLLAWPATLGILLRQRRVQALGDVIPTSEDSGFEGVAILMLVGGAIGAIYAGLQLYAFLELPGEFLTSGPGLLVMALFAMLLVRSVLHFHAGVLGTRGLSAEGASESAARYYNFGIISSVVAGAGVLLMFTMQAMAPQLLMVVMGVVYLLLIWPLLIRRFYTERNFASLLAGDDAPVHRRAPDAGLTALGWLLLALAVLNLSQSLPGALFGPGSGLLGSLLGGREAAMLSDLGRSEWWTVGLGGVQLWAAIELIYMSDRYKLATIIYGVVSAGVTVFLTWPILKNLSDLGSMNRIFSGFGAMSYGVLAMQLVIPVASLVLVRRSLTPEAKARFKG